MNLPYVFSSGLAMVRKRMYNIVYYTTLERKNPPFLDDFNLFYVEFVKNLDNKKHFNIIAVLHCRIKLKIFENILFSGC